MVLEQALGHLHKAPPVRTGGSSHRDQGTKTLSKSSTALLFFSAASLAFLSGCSSPGEQVSAALPQQNAGSAPNTQTVGVVKVTRHPVAEKLTVSSELVPFQEIDVYAKESGFVKQLLVDYGSHVRAGQLMAVLEIPELEAQLQQDQAAIIAQNDEVTRETHEVERVKAQHNVLHLEYARIASVAKAQPGLVAQQEVDDAQGKDLAAESQIEATQGALQAARSQLVVAKAKLSRDQALFAYARITAPFDGVVTQRYANLGALMQAGTSSSTQAMPLVRLSEEDLYRLVIPVPETYVKYIKVGDPIEVRVPSLGHSFAGKVTRFSVDVSSSTRTMHTEVDVENRTGELVPGLYAEAVLSIVERPDALALPLQALDRSGSVVTVFIVNPQGRLEQRTVTLGAQSANYAEALAGLREGENIVVSDRSGLKAGEVVATHAIEPMSYDASPDNSQSK